MSTRHLVRSRRRARRGRRSRLERSGPWRSCRPSRPGKIVAIGRNYADHAAERGVPPPAPIFRQVQLGAWLARRRHRLGRRADTGGLRSGACGGHRAAARDVRRTDALDHVLGYTCLNDVSARDLQFGDGQWIRGKSLDTFCPVGPWVVTADEIPDPRPSHPCLVNGEALQDASTAQRCSSGSRLIATARGPSPSSPATSSRPARRPASASSGSRPGSSPTATRS